MYRLKQNQRGHWCSLCKVERATKRSKYFTFYSCNSCLPQAIEKEKQEAIEESNYSEADYQTWMKL